MPGLPETFIERPAIAFAPLSLIGKLELSSLRKLYRIETNRRRLRLVCCLRWRALLGDQRRCCFWWRRGELGRGIVLSSTRAAAF